MTKIRRSKKRKLYNRKGFTLGETLLSVLILLMVSGIVAGGIPAARNAYVNVVMSSNAEVLLSTTVTELRNELGLAKDVKIVENSDKKEIVYFNQSRGASSKITLEPFPGDGENTIVLYRYFGDMIKNSNAEYIAMSSSSSSKRDMYVTYTDVTYANGIIEFTGLSVNVISGKEGLVKRDTPLSIRVISEQ